jgi:MFS family permease
MTSKRPRFFYGWLIVFVSSVGLFLGAPLLVFSFSVFFKPLVMDFHASRASVSLAFSLSNLVGALSIPYTGMVIDRFGAKRVILAFTLLYGLVLCSALWVGNSLWQLYLFFIVLGIAMASGPAPVPYGVVISHWFNRRRGLALAHCVCNVWGSSPAAPASGHRCVAPERPRTKGPPT